MLPEISVISARRLSISSIDRSVAEQPGIFPKPCEYFHACVNISTRSRGHLLARRERYLQFLCTVE